MFGKDHFAGHYGRLFFSPDDDGGGGGNGDGDKPKPDAKTDDKPKDPLEGLSPELKLEIQRRMDSASATARKEGEKAGLSKAQTDANAKAEADRVAKEQADLVAKGEFETAKKTLEGERDAEKARADRLLKIATADLEVRTKALDALGDKELSDAFAAITDDLDKVEWLNDPRTRRAMAAASEEKKVETANGKPKVPGTPKPNGTGKHEVTSLVNTRTF